ncbi:MAG: 50S ribosomal protein L29 [Anaerolineae bacterium]|nr:50S ribosomal protein L29 [Anaerolineae bacterium]
MKAREIRELSTEEIRRRLDDAYQELFNLRFQWATGQLKNHARMTQVKRDIARMKTILRERELQAEMGQEA